MQKSINLKMIFSYHIKRTRMHYYAKMFYEQKGIGHSINVILLFNINTHIALFEMLDFTF